MIRRVRGSATTRKAKKRRAHPPRPSCGRGRCFFPETDDREKTKIVPARSGTSFQDIYLTRRVKLRTTQFELKQMSRYHLQILDKCNLSNKEYPIKAFRLLCILIGYFKI